MNNQHERGNSTKSKRRRRVALSLLAIALLFIPVVMGVAGVMGIRVLSTPSGGNAPTLNVDEYFTINTRVYDNRDPLRGDMVIFRLPGNESVLFVKRVIGLPGEKVQIKDSTVFINGVAVPRVPIKDYDDGQGTMVKQFSETLPNGLSHHTLDQSLAGAGDNTPEFAIPDDHYFVMGDNRDYSTDSRFSTVGFVPRKNIYARAGFVVISREFSRLGQMLN